MNLVNLEKLNSIRFPSNPVKLEKLQRWCRNKQLPARKIGGEWYVDLDAFDQSEPEENADAASDHARLIIERLKASAVGA
jgi:hypothetical protein